MFNFAVMATLGEIIRKHRLAKGLTLEALSELSGVDAGTISALETRRSARSKYAGQIARGLGLTLDQLAGSDTGSTAGVPFSNVELVPENRFRRAPLIGWVQAGELTEFSDPFPIGVGDEYELVDASYGRRTVALRIKNNSMEPEFKEGDVIIVECSQEAFVSFLRTGVVKAVEGVTKDLFGPGGD